MDLLLLKTILAGLENVEQVGWAQQATVISQFELSQWHIYNTLSTQILIEILLSTNKVLIELHCLNGTALQVLPNIG